VEIPNFIAILNCQAPQTTDVHQGQVIPGDTETTGPFLSPATGRVRRLLPLIISCHVQAVLASQALFTCEQCGQRLKRKPD
jgi:hypothetical protein